MARLLVVACALRPDSMAAAQAPSFEPPVLVQPVDAPLYGVSARTPVAAIAGAGTWVVAWSSPYFAAENFERDDEILFARSLDGGLTFTTQAPLNSDAAEDKMDFFGQIRGIPDENPSLDGDPAGTLVAMWERKLFGAINVMLSRSVDTGQTWSTPAILHSQSLSPSVATDGAGTWIAVWTFDSPAVGGRFNNAIGFSRSTDGGATWSPPAPLFSVGATFEFGLYEPAVAWSGGVWMVTWSDYHTVTESEDIYVSRSLDGGATWTPSAKIGSGTGPDLVREHSPVAAGDGTGLWILAWSASEGEDPGRVVSVRSTDHGQTWSEPQPLPSPGGTGMGARLAVSSAGTFVGVWQEFGGDGADRDVFSSTSTDGGATWTPFEMLNEAETKVNVDDAEPFIACDPQGHWLAFWSSDDERLASGTVRRSNQLVIALGDHSCGNGELDAGETCDTGRRGDLDCCNNVCAFDSSGVACAADDELCTLERCDGAGTCENLPAPAGTPCTLDDDLCSFDRCNASAVCEHVLEPSTRCKSVLEPQSSSFAIEIGEPAEDSELQWSWSRGEAVSESEIVGQVGGRTYALCVYDETGLISRVEAPAGSHCTSATRERCWKYSGGRLAILRYKTRGESPGGISKLYLKEGPELKPRVKLTAAGIDLVPPPLPLTQFPLHVQLNNDVACWGATYSTTDENTSTELRATSD